MKISAIFFGDVGANGATSYHIGDYVTKIEEHLIMTTTGQIYYDVYFKDGHMEKIFNFTIVVFEPEENVKT